MNDKVLNTMTIDECLSKNNVLPALNELLSAASRSPYAYAKIKKDMENAVYKYIIRDLGSWKAPCRVRIDYLYGERSKGGLRDYDGISSGAKKIILDALVKRGVLEDDSPRYLAPPVESYIYTDKPFIKLDFVEAPPFEKKTK